MDEQNIIFTIHRKWNHCDISGNNQRKGIHFVLRCRPTIPLLPCNYLKNFVLKKIKKFEPTSNNVSDMYLVHFTAIGALHDIYCIKVHCTFIRCIWITNPYTHAYVYISFAYSFLPPLPNHTRTLYLYPYIVHPFSALSMTIPSTQT